jgi:hypothetical protein
LRRGRCRHSGQSPNVVTFEADLTGMPANGEMSYVAWQTSTVGAGAVNGASFVGPSGRAESYWLGGNVFTQSLSSGTLAARCAVYDELNRQVSDWVYSANVIYASPGSDHKVLNSGTDTTPNYLAAKLSAGTNIALSTQNGGGNENTQIAVTGQVGVGNGGTGLASYTQGDLLYASASNMLAGLHDVASGSVLASGGVGTAPSYVSPGGDISGAIGAVTVGKLQGRSVSASVPSDGQVLTWVSAGSDWEPRTPSSGGGSSSPDFSWMSYS